MLQNRRSPFLAIALVGLVALLCTTTNAVGQETPGDRQGVAGESPGQ